MWLDCRRHYRFKPSPTRSDIRKFAVCVIHARTTGEFLWIREICCDTPPDHEVSEGSRYSRKPARNRCFVTIGPLHTKCRIPKVSVLWSALIRQTFFNNQVLRRNVTVLSPKCTSVFTIYRVTAKIRGTQKLGKFNNIVTL